MQKGRNQKATGKVLGTAGGVLTFAGFMISLDNLGKIFDSDDPPKNQPLGNLLLGAGAGLSIASIPYHISGSLNRKKAYDILLETNTATKIENGKLMGISSPSFTLKIGL